MCRLVIKLILLVFLFCSTQIRAQETPDPSAFADFLFNSGLYEQAAGEYERLFYYDKSEVAYLKRLITCYARIGKNADLKSRIDLIEAKDPEVARSYYALLMQLDKPQELKALYAKQRGLFSDTEQLEIDLWSSISDRNWSEVKTTTLGDDLHYYSPIASEIGKHKYKNPNAAAALSALIPGAGRLYANDAKDGIVSLLFVGSFAYQSYRRFRDKGTEAVGGWIYGGLALGFYISNIYGSYQSARYYNKKLDEKIYNFSLPYIMDSVN